MPCVTAADGAQISYRDGVTLVGFSTGGGAVARRIGRHGTGRVAWSAPACVLPFVLETDDNPGGVPVEAFNRIRVRARSPTGPGSTGT